MKELMGQLREKTLPYTREGDPHSLDEQFRFIFSSRKIAFYWSDDAFVFLFKAPMGNQFSQVVTVKPGTENGRIKIKFRPQLNRVAFYAIVGVNILTAVCLVIGEIAGYHEMMLPFFFSGMLSLVAWMINRQHRKEARWFLEDLLQATTAEQ